MPMIDTQNITDEELFLLVKKDNSNALKMLFKKYYENLCFFSYSFVKDRYASQEVVSDIFIILWEKRKRIIITGKIKSYLYAAVKNQSLNYIRKNRIHFESIDEVDRLLLTVQDNSDDIVNYEELQKIIDGVIDKLPEKRKLIFQMNKFDELSYEEIANILTISVSTVRNQMIKAVKFLNNQYPALKKIISLLILSL